MKKYNLYDMESIELFEYIEELKRDLYSKNNEYRKIYDKIEKIKCKYSKIRGILEDEQFYELSLIHI